MFTFDKKTTDQIWNVIRINTQKQMGLLFLQGQDTQLLIDMTFPYLSSCENIPSREDRQKISK